MNLFKKIKQKKQNLQKNNECENIVNDLQENFAHIKSEQVNTNVEILTQVVEEEQNETSKNLKNQKETEDNNTNSINQTPLENLQKNKGDDNKNDESVLKNQKEDSDFLKFKLKLLEKNEITDETFVGICITDNDVIKGANFLIKGNVISGKKYNNCTFPMTNLYQTKIKNAKFKDCVFTNVIFKEMELENIVFDNCVFKTTHLIANFNDVYCRNIMFKECNLIGLRMERTFGNLIDMTTCKFNNVNIVCSDIHAFALPKEQQYRYGVVLDKPIKGFKRCLPLTGSQYIDIINGYKEVDDFFRKSNINREIFPREANFDLSNGDYLCVVELEIPIGAYVSTVDNIRFRTNIVRITNILPIGRYFITSAISEYDKSTIYNVGEAKTVSCFDTCPTNEFTNGIYFSMYNQKTDIEEHNE